MPEIDEEIDRCIECGFCEPKCPSRDLTLTPRQRILVRRESARLRAQGRAQEATSLEEGSTYQVLDTCATDGLCATACPVGIDTGRMVKLLRGERHGAVAEAVADKMARHYSLAEAAARAALRAGHAQASLFGHRAIRQVTRISSFFGFPAWSPDLPHPAASLPETRREGACALYFPSCITRVFGPEAGARPLAETVVAVAARAGAPIWIPPQIAGTCCGMPFSSKGFKSAHVRCVNSAVERLWEWTGGGELPVVLDTSPCAYTLKTCREALREENRRRFDGLRILDSIEFAHATILPGLEIKRKVHTVALHPVCSVTKMNLGAALRSLAAACATEPFVPIETGCCGFAGDRGFLHPELTEAATRAAAAEIRRRAFDGYYSSSRTCEIGMSRATGSGWCSFWTLLDQASR
jgi:D-lactate dehydrogenase